MNWKFWEMDKANQESSWFRQMRLWAWWEILCVLTLCVATAAVLAIGYMANWPVFAGMVAIAAVAWIWHFGYLGKTCREWLLAALVGGVLGPLGVCAGLAVGTHKADEWSKYVTYAFSPKKEKAKEPEKEKEKKKEIDPGLGEYFDGQFAKLREEMNGIRTEVKGVRRDVDGMKRRLKIDFENEEEPLNFPEIVAPEPQGKKVPDPPEELPEKKLRMDNPPEELPPMPIDELPDEAGKKADEAPKGFKRVEPKPKPPGKQLRPPGIAGAEPEKGMMIGSECSEGVFHPASQFCKGQDGKWRFVDEKDRCVKSDGKPCTCKRWVHEGESEMIGL